MSNYEKAFDLIGISRSGGGFGLSGGATGEAPYDPYRMWVDKGNIHENSSIGVSQQLKKQGQIEAKAREEYEREQRKQWDEAHKNEKSGSFSDAEKQQRDADIKQKMKEYDSDLTLQKKTIKRIRPDLSSAEAANERRAAERKGESKQQREDAALAAAHSYLEGIDDGHGEPDLSSGGTPPPKKKQSVSGDTNKVAQEALEKTASQKETSAAEIKRPVIVEPDNLEMKDDATLLTYETEGVYYALYAYNEDEFGQVVIPTDITDLIGYGYYGDYLLNIGEGGAITLAEHTEVDEVPPATMPWSMLFGEYIDGVGYRWDEKRSGAPFGAWCIGYGGNEYHPFTAFGSAGQVLTAQGEDAPPFFSHLDITDLVANGYAGEYVVKVVGGKVGLSSLPPDDVGLEVVTPEDLVMYNDADVLYGIGYAFYAYDGENFGQTTIPPPSDSQYQMLFGADPSTNPGGWVTETPTPGSLMFINYNYAAPAWIPTPPAAGAVLKTVGGTSDPVFESMYIQELLSTGGPGTFVLGVDVDGTVSLSTHTEVNEVPPSARKWDMLFGANQSTNPGEWAAWYAETYGLMWFNYDATSESYNPALIGQSDSGKVLVSTGLDTPPAFSYLDITDLAADGFNGEYVVNVVGGKVGLSSLPIDDVGLEVVTPSDLVMVNSGSVQVGYALYAYSESEFGQFEIPYIGWCGLVYVGENQFYDADIVPVANRRGVAIVDNSTGGSKTWVKVLYNGGSFTADEAYIVSYEDEKPSSIPQNEWWYRTEEHPSPIVILNLFGADAEYQVYQRLANVGDYAKYGFGKIKSSAIDATNSPSLNQYPKYSGNNKVTWTNFPAIPDVSDFLKEVTPSDLVMVGGSVQVGYALYAYSESEFGQFEIPDISGGSEGDVLTHDGFDPIWLSAPEEAAVMVFDYANTTPKWIAPSADYEVLYRYNGELLFGELRAT